MREATFAIRSAQPSDVPDLIRMKSALAAGDGSINVVRATSEEWTRDLFGSQPRFVAFIAESANTSVGMATCSERYVTGWPGPIVYLQDLFVDPAFRRHGMGAALIERVAAHADACGSPIIEINVHADNPAREFYRRHGFQQVDNCVVLVGGVHALPKREGSPGRCKE
jgi:ribosomal protein S18 acetylase RimI-like enzyme